VSSVCLLSSESLAFQALVFSRNDIENEVVVDNTIYKAAGHFRSSSCYCYIVASKKVSVSISVSTRACHLSASRESWVRFPDRESSGRFLFF
jgi:hypothetical protein